MEKKGYFVSEPYGVSDGQHARPTDSAVSSEVKPVEVDNTKSENVGDAQPVDSALGTAVIAVLSTTEVASDPAEKLESPKSGKSGSFVRNMY